MKKLFLLAFLSLVLLNPINGNATIRGYDPRTCGFDMDHDGRVGEDGTQKFCQGGINQDQRCSVDSECPGSTCSNTGSDTNQDCNVCDGSTTNVDGVAGNENLIYVDCESGNDTTGNGSTGTPYKTISKAFTVVEGQDDDGGAGDDSVMDIICFRGTCSQQNGSAVNALSHNLQGSTNTYTKTRRGDDAYAFDYSTKPVMLVGWDQDNDGKYPPVDIETKPPVLEACSVNGGCTAGNGSGTALLLAFDSAGSDNIEVAHFTVKNYGDAAASGTQSGFWHADQSASQYNYIHDLELDAIGAASASGGDTSGHGVFRFFAIDADYLAIENNNYVDVSMYPLRSPGGSVSTYLRFKNNTINPQAGYGGEPTRFWFWTSVEFTNNKFTNEGKTAGDPAFLGGEISVNEANQKVYITGNEWVDFSQAIISTYMWDSGSSFQTDPSDGLYIRRNIFRFTKNIGQITRVVQIRAGATDGIERSECTGSCTPSSTCFSGNSYNSNSNCGCLDAGDGHGGWKNVYVQGNVWDMRNMNASTSLQTAFEYQNGNNCGGEFDVFGPLYFESNSILGFNPGTSWNATCWVGCTRGALVIGTANYSPSDFRNTDGDVYIRNNIFTGLDNDTVLINVKRGDDGLGPISGNAFYTPSGDGGTRGNLYMDRNTYSGTNIKFYSEGAFTTGSTALAALQAFQAQSGEEDNGKACTPSFDTNGYTLLSGDTCAKDSGGTSYCTNADCASNADCTTSRPDLDLELTTRPQNTNCDIGADEYLASSPGTIQLDPSSYTIDEQNGTVTVYVSRSGGSSGAASVSYATVGVTATSGTSCTAGVDFITPTNTSCTASTAPYACCTGNGTGTCGTLSWADGNSDTKSFTINVCDDSQIESNEVVNINLSSVTGASFGSAQWGSLSIIDNDVSIGTTPKIDTDNPPKSSCESTNDNSFTIPSVTVSSSPSKPNKILVVAVGAEGAYNSGDPLCDLGDGGVTVSWNSTNLTRAISVKGLGGTTNGACSGIFYLLNPPNATSNVTITFAATALDKQAVAFTIYNAYQGAPFAVGRGSASSSDVNTSVTSQVVTAIPDMLLLDMLTLGNRVGGGNIVQGVAQTELADVSCDIGGSHSGSSSKEIPTPATTNMSWSWTPQSGEGQALRFAHSIIGFSATSDTTPTTTTTIGATTTTTLGASPTEGYACIMPCDPEP